MEKGENFADRDPGLGEEEVADWMCALSSNNDGNAIQIGPTSGNGFWPGMPPQQQRQIQQLGVQ